MVLNALRLKGIEASCELLNGIDFVLKNGNLILAFIEIFLKQTKIVRPTIKTVKKLCSFLI